VTRGQLSESKNRNRVRVVSGNDGLGVRGLEERHGGSGFSLEESGVGTVGALVSVVSFVPATETSDAGVCDAVSASNHFARLHKTHAIFFLECRLLAARVTARLFLFGRLEIDKGCRLRSKQWDTGRSLGRTGSQGQPKVYQTNDGRLASGKPKRECGHAQS